MSARHCSYRATFICSFTRIGTSIAFRRPRRGGSTWTTASA
nr:MAG TPA: hypothetical protein [Caudoviricetes sp.]